MDLTSTQSIANIVFLVIIGLLSIAAILSIYVVIKYGRTFTITSIISMVFAGVFILQVIAAFATLQFAF